jgi:hypothetical protein
LYRRLGGPQSRSGRCGVEKNLLLLSGIEPRCDRKLDKIHNDGIHKYNFYQILIRGGGMHIGYWWESQKERDRLEHQDVDGWTILKWILER